MGTRRRGRLLLRRRPQEGDDHPRRLQRLSARDRGGRSTSTPAVREVAVLGVPHDVARRGGRRGGRAAPRRGGRARRSCATSPSRASPPTSTRAGSGSSTSSRRGRPARSSSARSRSPRRSRARLSPARPRGGDGDRSQNGSESSSACRGSSPSSGIEVPRFTLGCQAASVRDVLSVVPVLHQPRPTARDSSGVRLGVGTGWERA